MEFVDGPDLHTFLNDTPQPFDVLLALSITRGIAERLGAAHSKRMVHRDINPENILMVFSAHASVLRPRKYEFCAPRQCQPSFFRSL
jgi:serine/threonine protein kinase